MKMNYSGILIGFIFLIISILLTKSFVGPIFIIDISESIGSQIDAILKIGNIGGTTFYTSVMFCVISLAIYLFTFLIKPEYSQIALYLFFITILIFLNSALFYYDIRKSDSHIDGQQIFNIIEKPLNTCWVYPIFGFLHEYFFFNITNKEDNEN